MKSLWEVFIGNLSEKKNSLGTLCVFLRNFKKRKWHIVFCWFWHIENSLFHLAQ